MRHDGDWAGIVLKMGEMLDGILERSPAGEALIYRVLRSNEAEPARGILRHSAEMYKRWNGRAISSNAAS